MVHDVEHLLICLLAICMFSSMKRLFIYVVLVTIKLFIFSQLQSLAVQDQSVSRAGFFWGFSLRLAHSHLLPVSLHGSLLYVSLCPSFLFIQEYQSYYIRAYPHGFIQFNYLYNFAITKALRRRKSSVRGNKKMVIGQPVCRRLEQPVRRLVRQITSCQA